MHTIKLNVFSQRSRFYQLYNAMQKCKPVEGCFVTDYKWTKEQGEVYAIFLLYESDEHTTRERRARVKCNTVRK
jgi:hypothetical protein